MTSRDDNLDKKPAWQKCRDIHGAEFPENFRNWLALDIVWNVQADAAENAVAALLAGKEPSGEGLAAAEALERAEVRVDDWIVDEPMTARGLDPGLEWMLLWREADGLTAMTLYGDATFERVFRDESLGEGAPFYRAIAIEKASAKTTKKLPPKKG
jgi:hypothetical protein